MIDKEQTLMWRENRERVKAHRSDMLSKADTAGWTKHTDYHYSRMFAGKRFDWWPSGGKGMYEGRMIYGHRKVNSKIAKLSERDRSEGGV